VNVDCGRKRGYTSREKGQCRKLKELHALDIKEQAAAGEGEGSEGGSEEQSLPPSGKVGWSRGDDRRS